MVAGEVETAGEVEEELEMGGEGRTKFQERPQGDEV